MRGVFFVPSKVDISNYKKRFDHAIRSSSVRQRRKTTSEEAADATRERETLVGQSMNTGDAARCEAFSRNRRECFLDMIVYGFFSPSLSPPC